MGTLMGTHRGLGWAVLGFAARDPIRVSAPSGAGLDMRLRLGVAKRSRQGERRATTAISASRNVDAITRLTWP